MTSLVLLAALSGQVTLVEDGVPKLSIVPGSVEEPIGEFQRIIERMTGTRLESGVSCRGVHIGLVSDFPWVEERDVAALGEEGCVIRTDADNLFLLGRTPRGVQHAVATFFMKLGCRWYFPGATWEVIPRRKTIAGAWNERSVPSFPTQRRIWYGFGAYPEGRRAHDAWVRHNRMGGPREIRIGHTWHGLIPDRDFGKHPDWFALVDGKRKPAKPCYSHPEVIRIAVETALAQAADGRKVISMTPPDGLGYCECDRCLKILEGTERFEAHRTVFGKRPDGTIVNVTSETLFGMINRVAEAVAARHPDVLIGCYAYSAYSHPPSFTLHPNVYLQTTTAYRRTPLSLEEQLGTFGKRLSQLGIREYYSVYQWDWDWPDPGKMKPATVAKDLRFFHRSGITAVNAESSCNWAARGLGYYVASRLMWNVGEDVDALVADFFERSFGPAAAPMRRYLGRWETTPLFTKGRFDVDALAAAFDDLDEARRLAKGDAAILRRIDFYRMYGHYLALRLRLHRAKTDGEKVAAIGAETRFGGRITNPGIIHGRPLLGKAFLRRFRKYAPLLEKVPDAAKPGAGWRVLGEPPSPEELDRLWAEDRTLLKTAR